MEVGSLFKAVLIVSYNTSEFYQRTSLTRYF